MMLSLYQMTLGIGLPINLTVNLARSPSTASQDSGVVTNCGGEGPSVCSIPSTGPPLRNTRNHECYYFIQISGKVHVAYNAFEDQCVNIYFANNEVRNIENIKKLQSCNNTHSDLRNSSYSSVFSIPRISSGSCVSIMRACWAVKKKLRKIEYAVANCLRTKRAQLFLRKTLLGMKSHAINYFWKTNK